MAIIKNRINIKNKNLLHRLISKIKYYFYNRNKPIIKNTKIINKMINSLSNIIDDYRIADIIIKLDINLSYNKYKLIIQKNVKNDIYYLQIYNNDNDIPYDLLTTRIAKYKDELLNYIYDFFNYEKEKIATQQQYNNNLTENNNILQLKFINKNNNNNIKK